MHDDSSALLEFSNSPVKVGRIFRVACCIHCPVLQRLIASCPIHRSRRDEEELLDPETENEARMEVRTLLLYHKRRCNAECLSPTPQPVEVLPSFNLWLADHCRWQRLNNSLERVTAVHDGGDGDIAGPGHDAKGIHLDLVHDVIGTQGWDLARMTQLPPADGQNLHSPSLTLPGHTDSQSTFIRSIIIYPALIVQRAGLNLIVQAFFLTHSPEAMSVG